MEYRPLAQRAPPGIDGFWDIEPALSLVRRPRHDTRRLRGRGCGWKRWALRELTDTLLDCQRSHFRCASYYAKRKSSPISETPDNGWWPPLGRTIIARVQTRMSGWSAGTWRPLKSSNCGPGMGGLSFSMESI